MGIDSGVQSILEDFDRKLGLEMLKPPQSYSLRGCCLEATKYSKNWDMGPRDSAPGTNSIAQATSSRASLRGLGGWGANPF